jgi:hypothetical protein
MRTRTLVALILILSASFVKAIPLKANERNDCERTKSGYRCLYGPFHVTHGPNEITEYVAEPPPEPGYITSALATVVDMDGEHVSRHMVHLHHSGWLDSTRRDSICDAAVHPIYGTGKERLQMELPPGYGYFWSNEPMPGYSDPAWFMYAELHGMHRHHEMDVYIQLKLGFTPASEATLTETQGAWLGIKNCGEAQAYTVRRGSGTNDRHRASRDWEMRFSGRFVWGGGHLHDGAIKLVMKNVTKGSQMIVSKALYDNRDDPWFLTGTTHYSDSTGFPFDAGDVVRLTAVYDSTRRWKDVMGIMRTMVAPL